MKNVKDLCILTGGHILQGLLLLISTRAITFFLSPTQMGRFSLIYTISALFFVLFIVPVGLYMQRKMNEWQDEGTVWYFSKRYIYYLFFSGVFVSLIVLFTKKILSIGIDVSDWWIVVIMFGSFFFTYTNSLFYSALNLFKKRLWFVLCSNLTLFLSLTISVILVILFAKNAENWILGQILGQIPVIFIGGFLFFKIVNMPNEKEIVSSRGATIVSEVFHFVWPMSIASIVIWAQTQSYRFLLEGISGVEVVGFFAVGFNLSTKLNEKFESLFCSFYDPIFYSEISNSDSTKKAEAWNRYAKAFLPALFLVCCFICFGSPFIIKIFVSQCFQKMAVETLIWGSITSFLLCVLGTYRTVAIAKLNMKKLIMPYILGAVIVLGGILVLCPRSPYFGAGLSLSLGALGTLVYLIIEMYKLLPISFPKKRMILAIIYSLPMAVVFVLFKKNIHNPTILQSLTILVILGIYLLFAQVVLAKDWILKSSPVRKLYPIEGV